MTAKVSLQELQFEQLEHDKLFHPDIMCLPVQRRVCHMSLHFAKYAGKFVLAKQTQDRSLLVATLVDTFIILLAVSNIFNKSVSSFPSIANLADDKELVGIGKFLLSSSETSSEGVYSYIADSITICAGKIAKAVESLDHLESVSYVTEILDGADKILEATLVTAFYTSIDLATEVRSRLVKVERKSIFFDKLRGKSESIKFSTK